MKKLKEKKRLVQLKFGLTCDTMKYIFYASFWIVSFCCNRTENIFEESLRNLGKLGKTRKLWYVHLCDFWVQSAKIILGGDDGH